MTSSPCLISDWSRKGSRSQIQSPFEPSKLGFFRPSGARPRTEIVASLIDGHRAKYGVEPICAELPIAPATYYEHKVRQRDPLREPVRVQRDRMLAEEVRRVRKKNFEAYGAWKVWLQLNRENIPVARCTSVGHRGDSYDNALAETIIGLYKTEVIRHWLPWRTIDMVEDATLKWVDWFNNRRLLESIGDIPPAEREIKYYRQMEESAASV